MVIGREPEHQVSGQELVGSQPERCHEDHGEGEDAQCDEPTVHLARCAHVKEASRSGTMRSAITGRWSEAAVTCGPLGTRQAIGAMSGET